MSTEERFSLDVVNVASPCPVPWESMTGDEHVRYCSKCELNVYDLSSLSRADAEHLVTQHEGRMCVHFYQRADGTVLTRDCPVGMLVLRRRLAKVLTGIAAMIAFLTCGLVFGAAESRSGRRYVTGPMTRFIEWIDPWRYQVAGDICAPPPTPAPMLPTPIQQQQNSGSTLPEQAE